MGRLCSVSESAYTGALHLKHCCALQAAGGVQAGNAALRRRMRRAGSLHQPLLPRCPDSMKRSYVRQARSSALSRLVAACWCALACALLAEFTGLLGSPKCDRQGGAAPGRVLAEEDPPPPPAATSAAGGAAPPALTWEEVDSLIGRPAGRHGRLAKQRGAVPANLTLLLYHMTNQNAELHGVPLAMGPALFRWFAFAHTFNKSAGHSNRGLQSPVPSCHFYVDHKYRLLYIRNSKTAGTSIIETLGMKENPNVCKTNPEWCYAKCQGKPVCMEYLWDEKQLRKAFAEYTVFTFVRNPWSRALSTWFHVHKYGLREPCQESFSTFAQLPSAYGAKCLANAGACCKKRFGWVLEHIEPQSRCLFSADGRPVVDFIGRVEHVDEDMQTLLDLINSRRPMGTEALSVPQLPRLMVGAEELGSDANLKRRTYAELYQHDTAALLDIRSYFHSDFELLQFPNRLPGETGQLADRGGGGGGSASGSGSEAGSSGEAGGGNAGGGNTGGGGGGGGGGVVLQRGDSMAAIGGGDRGGGEVALPGLQGGGGGSSLR